MRESWHALWREPRPDDAPARVWRDWVLVAGFAISALLEGVLAPDVPWRPFATVLAIALAPTLLWRRTHPLAMVAVAFGVVTAVQVAAVFFGRQEVGLA